MESPEEVNDQSGENGPSNEVNDENAINNPIAKEEVAVVKDEPINQNDVNSASEAINVANTSANVETDAPDSPGSALEIKGTVEGEADDGRLHSAKPSNSLDSSHVIFSA